MILEATKSYCPSASNEKYVLQFEAGQCFIFLAFLKGNENWIRVATLDGYVGQVPATYFRPRNDSNDLDVVLSLIRDARDACVGREDDLSYMFDHVLTEESSVLNHKARIFREYYEKGTVSNDEKEPAECTKDFRPLSDQVNQLIKVITKGPNYCDLEAVSELLCKHKSSLERAGLLLVEYVLYLANKHERRMKVDDRELILRSILVACDFDPSLVKNVVSIDFIRRLQNEVLAAPTASSIFRNAIDLLTLVISWPETGGLQMENSITPEFMRVLVLKFEDIVHTSGEFDYDDLPAHGIAIIDFLVSVNQLFEELNPLVLVLEELWSPPLGFLQCVIGMLKTRLKSDEMMNPHFRVIDGVMKMVVDLIAGKSPRTYLNQALVGSIFGVIVRGLQELQSGPVRLYLLIMLKKFCEQDLLPESGLDGLRKGVLVVSYECDPLSGEEKTLLQKLMKKFKTKLLA